MKQQPYSGQCNDRARCHHCLGHELEPQLDFLQNMPRAGDVPPNGMGLSQGSACGRSQVYVGGCRPSGVGSCSSVAAADAGDVGLQEALRASLDDHERHPMSRECPNEEDADIAQAIENSMSGNRHSIVSEFDLAIQNSLGECQPSSPALLVAQADLDRAIVNSMADIHSTPPTKMVRCHAQPAGQCSQIMQVSSRASYSSPSASILSCASI